MSYRSYRVTIKEVLIHTYVVDEDPEDPEGRLTKARAKEIAMSDGGNWKQIHNEASVIKVEKE